MFAFVGLIWWLDRYDREPIGLIAVTFVWGATGAVVLAMLGGVGLADIFQLQSVAHAPLLISTLVAPITEEPAKALILLPIIATRSFDNMTDGFVYGAAAGLGFAMTENFLYFVSVSSDIQTWVGTVVIRTFYSAVMHATATSVVGAALGWGRFRGGWVIGLAGAMGLGMAIGIHGVWNGLLALDQLVGSSFAWKLDLVLLPLEVTVTVAIFELCVLDEAVTIRRELNQEVANGILRTNHPRIIASWWRRLGRNWLPLGIDRDEFVRTATTLAMRKNQVRLMGDRAPDWYRADVERLRKRLKVLWSLSSQEARPAPDPVRRTT